MSGSERKRKAAEIDNELSEEDTSQARNDETDTVLDEHEYAHREIKYHKIAWTEEENTRLTDLVLAYDDSPVLWHEVAKNFPSHRSAKRCRERWVEYLDPALNTAPFTAHEDQQIIRYQMQYGNKWKQISNLLHESHRSSTTIKIRWHRLQRDMVPTNEAMYSHAWFPMAPSNSYTVPFLSYSQYALLQQQHYSNQQYIQSHIGLPQTLHFPLVNSSNYSTRMAHGGVSSRSADWLINRYLMEPAYPSLVTATAVIPPLATVVSPPTRLELFCFNHPSSTVPDLQRYEVAERNRTDDELQLDTDAEQL